MSFSAEYVIDIGKYQAAVPLKGEAMLFRRELQRAMMLVQESCERAVDHGRQAGQRSQDQSRWGSELATDRIHQNLGILGGRGAGKTSFLLTTLELLGEKDKLRQSYQEQIDAVGGDATTLDAWKSLARRVVVAGLVEPALMDPGEDIVAAVYAKLLDRVRRQARLSPPENRDDEAKLDRFMRASQRVTELLPVLFAHDRLEEVFKNDGAEGLHDEIIHFRSGFNLERAMWELIECYLAIEGKDLVVLAIDDVDLAHERGWHVLESLRRYLTSPQMLILVTGDPKLFRDVLQGHYGQGKTPKELSEEICDQYLKKLLPLRMRIDLPESVASRGLGRIGIRRGNPVDSPSSEAGGDGESWADCRGKKARSQSKPPKSEVAQAFSDHYADVLTACLRIRPPKGHPVDDLTHDYSCLIPNDLRRFLELCRIDVDSTKLLEGPEAPGKGEESQKDEGSKKRGESSKNGDDHSKSTRLREQEDAKEEVFLAFARVWEGKLREHRLTSWRLRDLARHPRIGIKVLNHLLQDESRLDEVVLRLDPRTDQQTLNLALAFLRFAIEANLDRRRPLGTLAVGLDFCVPAHYLNPIKSSELLPTIRDELELHLFDSPRRLYRRLVPWVARRSGAQGGIQPGIVPLAGRVGALETFLDLQDTTQNAAWRWILADPELSDTPGWLHQAARKCGSFLRQELPLERGFDWRNESSTGDKTNNEEDPCVALGKGRWREMSGYRWATRYLPSLLYEAQKRDLFAKGSPRIEPGGRPALPLISECVTTPRVFYRLAGALPRVILRCWMIDDGAKGYLTPWQCLTLIQRLTERAFDFMAKKKEEQDATSDQAEGSQRDPLEGLHLAMLDELGRHLDQEQGLSKTARDRGAEDRPLDRGSLEGTKALQEHLDLSIRLLEDARAIEDTALLFPDVEKLRKARGGLSWCLPPTMDFDSLAKGELAARAEVGQRLFDCWDTQDGKSPTDEQEMTTWNEVLASQLEAREKVLERFALAITEWAVYWIERWKDIRLSGFQKIRLDNVQLIFDIFLEDLSDEKEFSDKWSGAGDIIQRWIFTFLNAVLIGTLQPPRKEESGLFARRPNMRRGRLQPRPVREQPQDHPLYQNLTRLARQALDPSGTTKELRLDADKHWHPSDAFLALASFPIFAMFLPSEGVLPKSKKEQEKDANSADESQAGAEAPKDHETQVTLQDIAKFGELLLQPLPKITYFPSSDGDEGGESSGSSSKDTTAPSPGDAPRTDRYRLDLAGLSWCGLPLRTGAKEGDDSSEQGFNLPVRETSARRDGLIAMLNSVAADVVEPVGEAAKHRVPLVLAVLQALNERQGKQNDCLEDAASKAKQAQEEQETRKVEEAGQAAADEGSHQPEETEETGQSGEDREGKGGDE